MNANLPETPNEDSSAKAEATLAAAFLRPYDELHIHRGNLPHWRQTNVTYFVTTRLADSMPQKNSANGKPNAMLGSQLMVCKSPPTFTNCPKINNTSSMPPSPKIGTSGSMLVMASAFFDTPMSATSSLVVFVRSLRSTPG